MWIFLTCAITMFAIEANGHGGLVEPPPINYGNFLTRDMNEDFGCAGLSCFWFTNQTFEFGVPTISDDSPLRTYRDDPSYGDVFASNPWRAPGTARVFSPCGPYGGNPDGCEGVPKVPGTECAGGGFALGEDAGPFINNGATTTWTRGSVVEAKWGIAANHGGGYSYRLCKRPENASLLNDAWLSEECFQSNPLTFDGDQQWIEFRNGSRVVLKASRVSNDTVPEGSMWTRNPIPAWGGLSGQDKTQPPQFDPQPGSPVGFGSAFDPIFKNLTIVDHLNVPSDVDTGSYVLSWRWDTEQTHQVWTTCALIQIDDDDHDVALAESCGPGSYACGGACNGTGKESCEIYFESGPCTMGKTVCESACHGMWIEDAPLTRCGRDGSHKCGLGECGPSAVDPNVTTCEMFANRDNFIGKLLWNEKVCVKNNGTWF